MYLINLFLHSWLRWIVAILIIGTLLLSLTGWVRKWRKTSQIESLYRLLRLAMGVQILIGLILYFITSPTTTWFLYHKINDLVHTPQSFFTLIHPIGMFIAFLTCRAGEQKVARLSSDNSKMKTVFFFTLAVFIVVTLTIPWPFYSLGRPLFRF